MVCKVPPGVDSVGVNSKEKFGIFIFFTMLVSLSILVSEITTVAKFILRTIHKVRMQGKGEGDSKQI